MANIPLSLYVHFPWCVKKCPYCDFNSHAVRDELPEHEYVDALIRDFRKQVQTLTGQKIQTVFMGGGTPSLISPAEIQRLLNALRESALLCADAEITLEANPGTLDASYFEAYLAAGVNRLSIGVQSFDDRLLQKIGRIHSSAQAHHAIAGAQAAGFERINLDLMYGLPGQSLRQSGADIKQALASGVSHLSVYQLTIEPNTEFAVNTPKLPDADVYWEMHEQAQELLAAAGFAQYEVSAYSKASPSRHNLNYWQFGDYLAIGAGAHGKLSRYDGRGQLQIERYWNHRQPKAYMQSAQSGVFCAQRKSVPAGERDFEFLMNALRLKSGFCLAEYQHRTGCDSADLLMKLRPFIERKWLTETVAGISPTSQGYQFLDSMLLEFLPPEQVTFT